MPQLSPEIQALALYVKREVARIAAAPPSVEVHPQPPEVRVEPVVNVPAPQITFAAGETRVTVDTTPVAEAMDRQTEALARIADALEALAARGGEERPRRVVRIRHSDGSESTVREE